MSRPRGFAAARAALERDGVLLQSDARLPSVATIVAGGPVEGSWWGHPAGKAIYRTLGALSDTGDVLFVPLANGKETLVHRWLWPCVLAIATAQQPWQTKGLAASSRRLLARVRRVGETRAVGNAVRDLERRLLVQAESFHTESGAHAKRVRTWERWARANRVRAGLDLAMAGAPFEVIALGWWAKGGGKDLRWPWPWPQGSLYDAGRRPRRTSSTGR